MDERIRLRPTRLAMFFALLCLIMLGAAINYGNNLSFLVAFMLIGIAINGAWQTRRQLARLQLQLEEPAPRHAGSPGQLRLLVSAEDHARPGLRLSLSGDPVAVSVPADRPVAVQLPLPAMRRGRHALPPIFLETTYPLGLWQASRQQADTGRQWVWPAPRGDLPLPALDESRGQASPRRPGDEEFHALRGYHPGDPLTRIAFKRSAGTPGGLLTKTFVGQPGGGDLVDLDYARATGDPETRLSQLASWILQAESAARPWRLVLPGQPDIGPGLGPEQSRRAMQALALFVVPGVRP
ncbi:MAG: DUF58 domain-containing protein [Halothiobacillaceae bacterium]